MSHDMVPVYALVGDRPVKAERDLDGNTWIWAWDWTNKEFVKAPEYFEQVFFPSGPDVEVLSAEDFDARVKALSDA